MGGEGDGINGFTSAAPRPTEASRAWAERYEARFGEEAPKNASAATCYDEVMLWADAVKRVGDVEDYQAVCKAIEDYPYEGLCGVYDFNEDHMIPGGGTAYPQQYLQIQNGKIVAIYAHLTPISGTVFVLPSWLQ